MRQGVSDAEERLAGLQRYELMVPNWRLTELEICALQAQEELAEIKGAIEE
jgi:hypothetical protein